MPLVDASPANPNCRLRRQASRAAIGLVTPRRGIVIARQQLEDRREKPALVEWPGHRKRCLRSGRRRQGVGGAGKQQLAGRSVMAHLPSRRQRVLAFAELAGEDHDIDRVRRERGQRAAALAKRGNDKTALAQR
jgi:hypothetical protein